MLLKKYKGSRLYETRCKSFADIVGKFADAQSIISRLDEGDGVLAALVNHCTKWHKSGRSFYCEHELECTARRPQIEAASAAELPGPYPGIDPGWVYSFTPTATA